MIKVILKEKKKKKKEKKKKCLGPLTAHEGCVFNGKIYVIYNKIHVIYCNDK
jgi:hypothetical protein